MVKETELFRVVIKDDGNPAIKFSDVVKSSVSIQILEKLLKQDLDEHLLPIVVKILELMPE
ncbi:hypothetical protein OD350_28670 (plasmid) [Clostridium beijerinckii]|uniref:hypothetical protein n=1 Tax=Clostridium beijerinckii TaxID=1520 RepID=UPI0022274217|nr:hypothetical protein [Clostridium beijerinckii]UYZ39048.1 hypothetical protein OD350_28670 [Clostridium beijerinckii]